MNRIHKLDLLKAAACIGVVFTHVTFPGIWGKAVMRAAGFAVPVFCMTAGYFAWGRDSKAIRRRLFRILGILLAGYMLYFGYNAFISLRAGTLASWLDENFDILTPVRYLVFCDVGFAVHLWYLIAMAETYVLWSFALKRRWQQKLEAMLPILLLLQFVLVIYCDSLDLPWAYQTNFLLRALPWFLIGYKIRKSMEEHEAKADVMQDKLCPESSGAQPVGYDNAAALNKTGFLTAMIVTGLALAVLPSVLDWKVKLNVIGYVPYSLGLFLLAVRKPDKNAFRFLEYIGDRLSLYIYVLHILMAGAARQLMIMLFGPEIQLGALYQWIWPWLTLLISIAVSMMLDGIVRSAGKICIRKGRSQ